MHVMQRRIITQKITRTYVNAEPGHRQLKGLLRRNTESQ